MDSASSSGSAPAVGGAITALDAAVVGHTRIGHRAAVRVAEVDHGNLTPLPQLLHSNQ